MGTVRHPITGEIGTRVDGPEFDDRCWWCVTRNRHTTSEHTRAIADTERLEELKAIALAEGD